MRNLLIALTGFLVGTGLVVGLVLALPQRSGGTMSSGTMASASLATQKLTIQHVQKGCHVWSDGQTTGAMMRLHLKPGQRLSILDQDVDAHQMMELAGPMPLRMGGPMMTSHGMTLAFMKKGVYRLGTKTVEMSGGRMDVKTKGPDNNLRLLVTVA